ncbi:hypothetical protein FA95DRAFT_43671 [Auriscalpium vulgare]|uniref:Uncharacterized protein n=1 Tax=Auriscalpium vulgare TaxID=40419 RepID=A0ACB8SCW2_9AGAM|nr:hypothetical protein FA95DRAFT_43671 [Auriscalpium vulgare]
MSVVRALTQQELPLSPSSSLRGSSPMRGDDASPSASQARSYDNSQLSAGGHAQPLEASLSQEDGNHTDHSSQPGVSSRADTSVEGGFSVHGFSPDHDEDSQPHAGGSAQPMAFVATQPAISDGLTQALTQPATQPAETQPYDNTTGAQWQSMATTSTGARNLLANVPPEKRHRYQRYMPAAPPPTSDGNTQVVDEILPVQTGQELFEQILAHSNKTGNGQQETHAEDHDDGKTDPGDQTDVVPDSEPTQHPPTSSPERPLHLAIVTASSSRDSEARSRYITPPEEQDEEEEVPLAAQRANTAVHGKGKGKARGDAAAYKVPFPKTSQGAKVRKLLQCRSR